MDLDKIKLFFCNSRNFRLYMLLSMFFANVAFVDVIAVFAMLFGLVWSFFILFFKFKSDDYVREMQFNKLVFGFLISSLLTVILHVRHNFGLNLLYVWYSLICFIIFYGLHAEKNSKESRCEMFFFFKLMVIITTILSLLSIATLTFQSMEIKGEGLTKYKKIFSCMGPSSIDLNGYTLGIYQSRLIGIYTNANLLGFSAVIGIVAATIMMKRKNDENAKFKLPMWLCIACVVLNIICLFLSDSNGSFLFVIIYITSLLFCKLLAGEYKVRMSIILKRTMYLMVACSCFICISVVLRGYTQKFVIHMISEAVDIKNNADNVILTDKNVEPGEDIVIGRKKGINGYNDVSSGRIELWKQGIRLFSKHPVMGIGRANFLYYGELYLKDGLRFPDVHNGYLSILIAYGIIGFGWFASFGCVVAVLVLRYLFKQSVLKRANIFPKLFSFLVAYCVYALLEITFLSQPFFETLIFWFVLGHIMTCVKKYSVV